LISEGPILPVGGGAQQRNNSSNPKKEGTTSILVDDQRESGAMQTPTHDPSQHPKLRNTQLANSATRV
jgi:hypothetical protein